MRVAGVIIAGGKGTRLGGDKPLQPFLGATLIAAVMARVRPQVEALALNLPAAEESRYRARLGDGWTCLADAVAGDVGPLAGVLAGLDWADSRGAAWLACFPADTPFLPDDLVAQLLAAAGDRAAAAADDSGLHGLCAVWPVAVRGRLRSGVMVDGIRSLGDALAHVEGLVVPVGASPHAFFNVNTPDDLVRAEALAAPQR